jgi:Domain of unknown function (DUF2382)
MCLSTGARSQPVRRLAILPSQIALSNSANGCKAVVSKAARVKEEVVINKAATDRVETIRDTVRREDVEVTRDGQDARTSGSTTPPFRDQGS